MFIIKSGMWQTYVDITPALLDATTAIIRGYSFKATHSTVGKTIHTRKLTLRQSFFFLLLLLFFFFFFNSWSQVCALLYHRKVKEIVCCDNS